MKFINHNIKLCSFHFNLIKKQLFFNTKTLFSCEIKSCPSERRLFSNEINHLKYEPTLKHEFTSHSVRQSFINYFINEHQHEFVKSSSVIPFNDDSLLFVNAGMNQFKRMFLNELQPNDERNILKRVVNSQKCIRAGGKHCDLENVGHDLTHHTFFEMLGNWSFGDYHKKEACKMAWNLLTQVYKLNQDNLFVTYFGGDDKLPADDETKMIWHEIGIPNARIIPLSAKENFWEMGFTGPCGVCTEIHYSKEKLTNKIDIENLLLNSIEIWNLVFIQFNRNENGQLHKLPNHFVDTGMGLERLLAVLQGVNSSYETDLFLPFFHQIQNMCDVKPYSGTIDDPLDIGYRILADHSRMFTIALSDGLVPSWHKAGHVLRKIIRRTALTALEHFKVESSTELLCSLAKVTQHTLGNAYPELIYNFDVAIKILKDEVNLLEHNIERRKMKEEERIAKAIARRKYEEELNAFVELLQKEFEPVNVNSVNLISHQIQTKGEDLKLIMKVALDHFGHKPTALFYIPENDNYFYCQFSVPKTFKIKSSALNWFNSVFKESISKEIVSHKRLEKLVLAKCFDISKFDEIINLTNENGKRFFD